MKDFYTGKKILVTGSTGFKGSRLSLWLQQMGAEVIGYGLLPYTTPNNFDILGLDKKITQVIGDIRNVDLLEKTIELHKPEIIFHLAAQPLVRLSYQDPVNTIETNVMGTVHILEQIKNKEYIKGGVMITTDKVYENKEWIWPYRETDRLGGFDPYSVSKAMAELAIDGYVKSFLKSTKKIAVVRAGNVIGGGDRSKDRLLPDMVRSIMQDETLILRNPDAVRPWQYVLEALYGYLLIGMKIFEDDRYTGAYNFGPDIHDNLSVIDVVKETIEILGKGKFVVEKDLHLHEANRLLLDNTKAKTLLGWTPKYKVKEVLARTLNYYKLYYTGGDIQKLACEEIAAFN